MTSTRSTEKYVNLKTYHFWFNVQCRANLDMKNTTLSSTSPMDMFKKYTFSIFYFYLIRKSFRTIGNSRCLYESRVAEYLRTPCIVSFLKKNKSKFFPKTEFIGNPLICSAIWINCCISNSIGFVKEKILSLRYFVYNDATNFSGCQFVEQF